MAKLLSNRRFVELCAGVAILFCMGGLVFFPSETLEAGKNGVTLCFDVIIPSLFPFFVMSTLVLDLGLARYLGYALERVMRPLFNVGGVCGTAFALGFIGGYPVGAKTAIGLYEKGQCTKTEAERLLAFCNNSGPAFILGVVGAGIFASSRVGVMLYLAHAAASILVGMAFRFYKRGEASRESFIRPRAEAPRPASAFTDAVKSAFSSTLNICAFVIFFTVAVRMLFLFGIIPGAAQVMELLLSPLGISSVGAEQLLTGLIEITSGLWSLTGATGALAGKLSMAAFMLGWAGVSVHCQVLSFIGGSGLSTRTYILGKIMHGGVSAALVYLLADLFGFRYSVNEALVEQVSAFADLDFSSALFTSLQVSAAVCTVFLALSVFMAMRARRETRDAKKGSA